MAEEQPKVIKVKPWGMGQGDFVEINEDDFDETKHELFEEMPTEIKRGPGRPRKVEE